MSQVSVAQRIYSLLTESTVLMAKVTGVYDAVPEETPGPYIGIGHQQSLRGRFLDESERTWFIDLDIWSRYRGKKEILEIADVVQGLLPSEWFLEEVSILRDPSGWYHGVATIKGFDAT